MMSLRLSSNPLIFTLLFAVLILHTSACRAASPVLSIISGAGTVVNHPATAHFEFGTRQTSDDSPLSHTFLLHNGTKTVLVIERVAVSCDCVAADIGEGQTLPVKVQPGQTVPVLVSVIMRRLLPGEVSKSVWIYQKGMLSRGLRLEMHGTVHDASDSSQMGYTKTSSIITHLKLKGEQQ